MTDLKLIEKEPNHFTIDGTIGYYKDETKSVIVDGAEYTKTQQIYEEKHTSQFTNWWDWSTRELDVDFFDLKYKFTDFIGFRHNNSLARKLSSRENSQNDYVFTWQLLFEFGKLDKRIIRVYNDRSNGPFSDKIEYKLRKNLIPIELFQYGYANLLFIDIRLKDFLLITNKKAIRNHEIYYDFFKERGVDLDSGCSFKNVHKLLMLKINQKQHETRKQQKPFGFYL